MLLYFPNTIYYQQVPSQRTQQTAVKLGKGIMHVGSVILTTQNYIITLIAPER